MICFVVPGTPVAKGRPRVGRSASGHVRTFTPARTVAYEGLIALAGQQAMAGAPPIEGAISVTAFAHFPIPKSWPKKRLAAHADKPEYHLGRPDGDNILKAIGDGLNGVIWRDDSQIASAQIVKLYGETPQLVVMVRQL
ncbi:MAG: RusA family crossover junction endodeoxyribonuclease [Novosphingobium sp.]|jgi:Holliday junction resolvase RusA-like endonuclease|nr:RusA family crossover junction endodeoxyribonuclease [Novosphingobium sp.]